MSLVAGKKQPGYALATILVLLGVAMFGAAAIVTISTLESKITRSQQEGNTAYYAAESGVQDALWKLNNDSTFVSKLTNNQFSTYSYTLNNVPKAGQSFTNTISSTSPGYATVTTVGSSSNGSFTAQRQVQVQVFQGTVPSPTGNNAVMSGGTFSVTNNKSNISITNGDFYSTRAISINIGGSASFNLNSGKFYTASSSYSASSNVTSGGVVTGTAVQTPPGIDFTYYGQSANYTTKYNSPTDDAAFQSAITSAAGLPGPITYYNGSITTASWAKNKTLTINGMLIINGSLTANSNGMSVVVNDNASSHKAGIFVNGNIQWNSGSLNNNGILYTNGSLGINNTKPMTIDGALIAGGSVSMNTGTNMSLNYNSTRTAASFGSGSLYTAQIQHWEEEY